MNHEIPNMYYLSYDMYVGGSYICVRLGEDGDHCEMGMVNPRYNESEDT